MSFDKHLLVVACYPEIHGGPSVGRIAMWQLQEQERRDNV